MLLMLKCLKLPNMYRVHNANRMKIIGLVLLNVSHVIINLSRVKRCLPTKAAFVILSNLEGATSATLQLHDDGKFQVGCGFVSCL